MITQKRSLSPILNESSYSLTEREISMETFLAYASHELQSTTRTTRSNAKLNHIKKRGLHLRGVTNPHQLDVKLVEYNGTIHIADGNSRAEAWRNGSLSYKEGTMLKAKVSHCATKAQYDAAFEIYDNPLAHETPVDYYEGMVERIDLDEKIEIDSVWNKRLKKGIPDMFIKEMWDTKFKNKIKQIQDNTAQSKAIISAVRNLVNLHLNSIELPDEVWNAGLGVAILVTLQYDPKIGKQFLNKVISKEIQYEDYENNIKIPLYDYIVSLKKEKSGSGETIKKDIFRLYTDLFKICNAKN